MLSLDPHDLLILLGEVSASTGQNIAIVSFQGRSCGAEIKYSYLLV